MRQFVIFLPKFSNNLEKLVLEHLSRALNTPDSPLERPSIFHFPSVVHISELTFKRLWGVELVQPQKCNLLDRDQRFVEIISCHYEISVYFQIFNFLLFESHFWKDVKFSGSPRFFPVFPTWIPFVSKMGEDTTLKSSRFFLS